MFFINKKLHTLMEQFFERQLKERKQMDTEYEDYQDGPFSSDPDMEGIVSDLEGKFGLGADTEALYELAQGIKGGEFGFDDIDDAIEGLSILDETK